MKAKPRMLLTEGEVGPRLIRLAIPMAWGILTNMLFNLVDTFYIGRLGSVPLAAIGFTFPVVFVISGTAMGMGIGISSVVSRAIGEGHHDRALALTTRGIVLVVLLAASFILLGLRFHDAVFRWLGAGDELIPLIRSYMIPWFAGALFLVIPMSGNSAIRATGDSLTPSLIMITAGCVNILLDPLLIFGLGPFPRLEMSGAALATVLAYFAACCASCWVLVRREKLFRFTILRAPGLLASWKTILFIGLPAVGTNLLVPLANGILTRIFAGFGPLAVAAFGVGTRIEALMMVASFALSTMMAPFVGQNEGAGRRDRVREALRFGLRFCVGVSLVLWSLVFGFAGKIAGVFTSEPEIIRIASLYLMVVPVSYGGFGFMLQAAAAFNASARPKYSVLLFFSRLIVFTVPLALLGSYLAGIPGIFAGMVAGNLGSGLLAVILARRKF